MTRPGRIRRRHPYDKGGPFTCWLRSVLREIERNSTWRRHPAPFSKTRRGWHRRQDRRFAETRRHELLEGC